MSSWLGIRSAMEDPMSSSLGAMGPLLRKLNSLLPPEYRLPKPLKDKIELLKEDLEEISIALVEQSMVHSPNEMANYWMNEVREISYDIDDFVDYMMRTHTDAANTKTRSMHRHRVGRVKIAWIPKTLKPCKWVAKIAELRTLVREASERHDMYLDGCISSSTCVFTWRGRVPALYTAAANYLVGIDDVKTKLVELLTNEVEQQLKVVAIVGPAGVGKTTLAKQVYRELGGQFECRAFVRASRKPNMRRLLGGILSQVQQCSGPSDSCTVQGLIDNLTKHLQDKRYVIVIDDLWETTAWDIITSAFPDGNNCSRIVTTAEIEGVALECCDYQSNNIFKMKPLGREDSGKLFFNIVFGPGRSCPEQLREVSDITITKCAGLPLATICVAGLLASQLDNSEVWQHVQEYLFSNLSTNSTLEETLQEILKLSYNSLPHYLKTCLMYLSMYPEGYTMSKDDLVKQWVAECFIIVIEGEDTEDVAASYFDELVNRGMIQPVEINHNDEVLSCTLHHVVIDLITHKSNEEKFITALDYSQTITGFHSKARRLSLHFSNTRYATKPAGLTLSQVRSLVFFGILKCMPSIVEFKLLRVLVLEFWGDLIGCASFDLTRICRLFQLRYLKISCDASVEVELPVQMRRLQYLETLKINARVSAVPLDLRSLLHLSVGDKTNVPDGIGRLRSLRTLEYFDLGKSSEKGVLSLGKLINLHDLHLTYSTVNSPELLKRKLAALASSIVKLVNLKSVTLAPGALDMAIYHDCSSSVSSPSVFLQRLELMSPICILSRIPEWIGQLRKLSILKVVVSELLMKDLDILTGLPALTVFSLDVWQPTAESIIFKRGAFPALKCLKYRCAVLCLSFQKEALPNLQRLELSFNAHKGEQYGHLLAGIERLRNLKEIATISGATAGADDPYIRAAESAINNAIRRLGFNAHKGEQYGHLLAGIEHLRNLKEIATISGATAGADESDRRAAESAVNDAIRKHPRFPSYHSVKRVDRVDEEYNLRTQVKETEEDTNKCAASGTYEHIVFVRYRDVREGSISVSAVNDSSTSNQNGSTSRAEAHSSPGLTSAPRPNLCSPGSGEEVALRKLKMQLSLEDKEHRDVNTEEALLNNEPMLEETDTCRNLGDIFSGLEFGEDNHSEGSHPYPDAIDVLKNSDAWLEEDQLEVILRPASVTANENQWFRIHEVSPEWAFCSESTKVVIAGDFVCNPSHCSWAILFGDVKVPVEIVQQGVIRCHTPCLGAGKVRMCMIDGNGKPCSDDREFEFHENPTKNMIDANGKPCSEARELQSRREPTKSSDDLLLLLKYVQMLFDGDGCGLFSKFTLPLLNVETGFQVNPSESMKRTCEQLDHENTVNCVMGVLLNSKFDDWLSSKCEQTSEGNYLLPKQYHGVIHTVAALGYDWALKPLLSSGVPINYRDANGWTALHWAARFGREEMVVVLLAAGAAAGALSDPTSEDPAAKTPASIASAYGFKGLSAYLSEAELTTHLHSLESIENGYRIDHASGEGTSTAVDRISDKYAHVHGGSDDQLALKDSLGAIRNAVQAAGRIQAAFRVFSFRKKQEMSLRNRDSYILPIREAGVGSRAMLEKAALSIQKNFRCWKKRKEFLKIRKNVIQIQARVRAHQERNKYKELLQSVGILEKAMLRWYRKGVGLRGFSSGAMPIDDEEEDDIVRVFRKQRVETAINEAVSRVSNIVGCPIARHEYRRMLEYTNKQSMESSKSASSWCL